MRAIQPPNADDPGLSESLNPPTDDQVSTPLTARMSRQVNEHPAPGYPATNLRASAVV
ncbi:hypothetical protein VTH82DRAFT_1167 [Thermothelomyces myriococcoides]